MALIPIIMIIILWLTGFNVFRDMLNIRYSYWFAKLLSEQTGTFIAMLVLCSIMYAVIPNTRVKLVPAIIGGVVGGTLWQLNNMLIFMFVSNAIRTHYIYGSIGLDSNTPYCTIFRLVGNPFRSSCFLCNTKS